MGLTEVKERFNLQQDVDGNPWQPLRFPRPQGGGLVLLNQGLLRASFISEFDANSFRVGTNRQDARLHHHGGIVTPTAKQWLTIPLTLDAIYAGSAPAQGGLHFRLDASKRTAGLFDSSDTRHWLLVKRTVHPARAIVGFSAAFIERFTKVLTHYIRTGEL